MSISAIGNGGGFSLAQMASNAASKMVKDLDTNKDGSIDKTEFVSGMTANGVSAEDATQQFDSMDTSKAGKLSQSDIASAIQSAGPKGGPPPSGSAKAAGTAAASSTKTYDKKDLNEDGTVSTMETLIYDLKHSAEAASSASKTTATSQKIGGNVNVTA